MNTPTHNQATNSTVSNYNLNDVLKDICTPADQLDLGLITRAKYEELISNPIVSTPTHQELIDELTLVKQSLEYYETANLDGTLGIEYAGSLTAEEEVTQDELSRALDLDDLKKIEEGQTPERKRSNFWYVSTTRNEHDSYTIYHLANGNDKIIYDDELINNPRLKQKIELSNAREDGDRETYNAIKEAQSLEKFQRRNNTETKDEYVQCFLKVGSKLYGDAIDLPASLVKTIRENKKQHKQQRQLVSYLDMFKSPVKNLLKTCGKIKVVDQTLKCLAILQ